jgi:hypothetical protein
MELAIMIKIYAVSIGANDLGKEVMFVKKFLNSKNNAEE